MPSSGYRKQTMDFGDMSRDLQNAAASFAKMSAAAGTFVSLVGAFKSFELEVVRANSAIGGTAKTFKQLSDAARNFALVSKYSAGEAASSMVMLAQAGFDTREVLSAMPSVLQLAQASMENLDLVADTVASTIRTFNLNAEEASRVTNVFAASCVNSLATVNKLAFSFRQVGPVAAEMGLSLEETAAALDVLYNRGLRGEQAGTALRNIMVRLVKPTQDTQKAFSNLGIGLKNADGSARDLQAILSDLRESKISDTYLAKIFGREALAASKTLIAATTGEYEKMKETITDTNTVAKMAAAQMDTMDGSLRLMKNALTELGIILGESIGPYIKSVASLVQDLAIYLRTTDGRIVSLVKNFGSFVAILGSAKFGLSKLLGELNSLSSVGGKVLSGGATVGRGALFGLSSLLGMNNYSPIMDTQLRLKEISDHYSRWTDAYAAMNEEYKRITRDNINLSVKWAANIRNMTAVELAHTKALVSGARAWKTLTTAMKGALLTVGKLALVMIPLMAAFAVYDAWQKKQERQAQIKKELFPELDYLVQKIKEAKLAVTNDLPSIVEGYKKAMDTLKEAERSLEHAEEIGQFYKGGKEGGGDLQKTLSLRASKFAEAISGRLSAGKNITGQDFYRLGTEYANLEINTVDRLYQGYVDTVSGAIQKFGTDDSDEARAFIRKNFLSRVNDIKADFVVALQKGARESVAIIENSRMLLTQYTQRVMLSYGKDNLETIKHILSTQNISKENTDAIAQAYVRFFYGIPQDVKDINAWLKENAKPIEDALSKWAQAGGTQAVLEAFRGSEQFKDLTSEQRSFVIGGGTIEANVKIDPVDSTEQEAALASLRKNVSDMLADYRLSWELLSETEEAQIRLNKIQSQDAVNRATALKTQKDLVQKIYDNLQTEAVSWAKVKDNVFTVDKKTGELAIKSTILAEAAKLEDAEKRAFVEALAEQLDLTAKLLELQGKQAEKDKERLSIEEGRYKYEQEHKDWINKEIAKLDKESMTDFFAPSNLSNGITSGLLEVASQVDSTYDMMKEGMKGFADYMSDSMYSVVENWGKGWDTMKDALKKTLTDMLKELSQYFIKQSMYRIMAGLGPSTDENGKSVGGLGSWVASFFSGSTTNAKGSAWSKGLQTFATGGVVTTPTFFNTRSGKGLMGEAGPEAIMPLKRDSQGRLGVSASTSSTVNYAPSFNINMTTGEIDSQTSQRNANRMTKELDNQVKSAVLLVLAKEKRPGGLLYGGAK